MKKKFRLFLAVGLLFGGIYLAPVLDALPFLAPLVKFIDEHEIDAGALYYTEIEEFSEAEILLRNKLEY